MLVVVKETLLDDSDVSCRVESDEGIIPIAGVPCTGCNGSNRPFWLLGT